MKTMVQDLSREEMMNVNGGIFPVFAIAYYGTLACAARCAAIGGALLGYKANRDK